MSSLSNYCYDLQTSCNYIKQDDLLKLNEMNMRAKDAITFNDVYERWRQAQKLADDLKDRAQELAYRNRFSLFNQPHRLMQKKATAFEAYLITGARLTRVLKAQAMDKDKVELAQKQHDEANSAYEEACRVLEEHLRDYHCSFNPHEDDKCSEVSAESVVSEDSVASFDPTEPLPEVPAPAEDLEEVPAPAEDLEEVPVPTEDLDEMQQKFMDKLTSMYRTFTTIGQMVDRSLKASASAPAEHLEEVPAPAEHLEEVPAPAEHLHDVDSYMERCRVYRESLFAKYDSMEAEVEARNKWEADLRREIKDIDEQERSFLASEYGAQQFGSKQDLLVFLKALGTPLAHLQQKREKYASTAAQAQSEDDTPVSTPVPPMSPEKRAKFPFLAYALDLRIKNEIVKKAVPEPEPSIPHPCL